MRCNAVHPRARSPQEKVPQQARFRPPLKNQETQKNQRPELCCSHWLVYEQSPGPSDLADFGHGVGLAWKAGEAVNAKGDRKGSRA